MPNRLALVGAVFAAIAALLGPQRASADGNLVLYCAVQEEWCRNMVAAFERQTGIKVAMMRKSSGEFGICATPGNALDESMMHLSSINRIALGLAVFVMAPTSECAEPKYAFVTSEGAILCANYFAIKDGKAAVAAGDKSSLEKTGCVQVRGGLKVTVIDAPLSSSHINGMPTPSSDLPWRVRAYPPDNEADGVNAYVDPWEISTYAWATLPTSAGGGIMRGLNPVQFKSRADAERWYIQNVTDHMKPNVPHAVMGDNGGFQLLLGPAAYGLLDVACPISGKPSCVLLGQLPR
jgi:hypothetical protein